MKYILFCLILFITVTHARAAAKQDTANLITSLLAKHPEWFESVLSQQQIYQPQIIYTAIHRDAKHKPVFKTYRFHADEYFFYAASWMKLPLAVFTLEQLEQLHLSKDDILTISPQRGYAPEEWAEAKQIRPCSFAQIITEAMVVSNNAAYNLMYDFLGADLINRRFHELGYQKAVVCNRFSGCDSLGHCVCNPLNVTDARTGKILHTQQLCYLKNTYRSTYSTPFFGAFHWENGFLMPGPKNFTQRNYIPLSEMHRFITELFFPNATHSKMKLSAENYAFIKKAMRMLPRNCPRPKYSEAAYPDAYMKPMIIGGTKNRLPNSIKIYNKVGQYFGWTCDNAYVIDTSAKVEFILSVVIYTNSKQAVADDPQGYAQIAIPFISNLGKVFYDYELSLHQK